MNLENRVAIITGATGGLGRVVAHQFAEQGARLALIGRSAERLEKVAEESHLADGRWMIHTGDLAKPGAAQAAVEAVIGTWERAEILLHLVGGWTGGKQVTEVAEEEISGMLQQHLWTTFSMAQALVPHLVENQWGRLIVISSPYAAAPRAKGAPYAIAKAAQETLFLTLAQELKGSGVTANVLLVNTIDVDHERDREPKSRNASWSTPEEIASAMLYLCSDEARMVNGARIPLYGSP
ncbi:MAG: SDR family oxidoreductase [Anaerolineae bacterium]|nr:SDR family oxidoreductase [Anaerolineae bacterium]